MPDDEQERARRAGEGFIRIDNRQVYDLLITVRDDVAVLKGQMANVILENLALAKRARGLELKFYGIVSGLVAAAGYLLISIARGAHA